jgi:hypothetical protein
MAGRYRFGRIVTLGEIMGGGRRDRPPVATAPRCTIAFADGPTGIAHRVTEEAFAASGACTSIHETVCGRGHKWAYALARWPDRFV